MCVNLINLNNNFKKYRTEKGLSQKEFAEILKVKQSQLSKIENNAIVNIPLFFLKAVKDYDPEADLNFLLGYDETDDALSKLNHQKELREQEALITALKEDKKVMAEMLSSFKEMLEIIKKQKNA